MTLTDLRYLIALSQERHFGHAAEKCFVSQPTLSISIKKLEEELKVKIFDRSSNDLIITSIGQKIIDQAKVILNETEQMKFIAQEKQDQLAYPLKLGLIFTIAPYLLPKLITKIRDIAPNMSLILEENFTHQLTPLLKNGEIDAAIVADPFLETGIDTIPLYEEPFFVIVPKGHHFEALDEIDSSQLHDETLLLLTEGNCLRDQVLDNCLEWASHQKIKGLANTLQGNSITTVRYMVASGLAISVLPSTSLNENDHNLFSIIPFKCPAPSRKIVLAYRKNFIRPDAIDAIRKAVLASNLAGVSFSKD